MSVPVTIRGLAALVAVVLAAAAWGADWAEARPGVGSGVGAAAQEARTRGPGEAVPGARPLYLDVPGITQEEIDGIERVKAARKSLVFANERSSELFTGMDGRLGGAAVLISGWLTEFFGIRVEPAIIPWRGIVEGLEDGKVDFTGEMNPSGQRQRHYFMTTPISERSIQYMRMPGAEPLSEIRLTRPVRYAFLMGSVNFRLARDSVVRPYVASSMPDIGEAWRALASGKVDAYVAEAPVKASFDPFGEVVTVNILPVVTSEVSLTARRQELAPFISTVQKYLDSSGRSSFQEFYREGYRDYIRTRFLSSLTRAELEWVRNRSRENGGEPVLVGLEFDNYPISFYNEREGEFQGIAVDILNEIRDLTGLRMEEAPGAPESWPSTLDMLESGEISVVSELVRTPGREGRFLWTDKPYLTDRYAFLSLTGTPDVTLLDVRDMRVGLSKSSDYSELFWKWFPEHSRTVTYPDNVQPFGGLERGEVDLVMGTHNELLAMTNYLERPYFKVNILIDRNYESFFGISRKDPELRSIISKAQMLVDTEEIASRWRTRVFDYRGALARARMPFMAAGLGLLALVIVLLTVMFVRSRRVGRMLEEAVAFRTEELTRQIAISERASKAKSDFLARTSHEIRTPMNAIIGFSELAQREHGKPGALEYIRGIRSAGASLLTIINDILDFSKIESGGLQLAPAPYRASSLLNDAVTLIRVRMGERPVKLVTELSRDIPSVMTGDSGRIRQILLNLLSNAVKYTERGRIRLSAEAERVGEDSARLSFEVEDTGLGIRPEDLARLFGEFTRLDEKRNSGVEGTGLGLAIARSLCRAMGGDIEAESTYGIGSVFRAWIVQKVVDWTPMGPLAEGGGELQESGRASFAAPGAEVLIVDDYASNLMVAEGLLAPYGMRLTFASGGPESVALAGGRRFDLILMDHMMPEMDGMEACRAIRAMKGGSHVPIVALTANAVAGMREMYLANGFDDFLSKPVDPVRLDGILLRWIPPSKRGGLAGVPASPVCLGEFGAGFGCSGEEQGRPGPGPDAFCRVADVQAGQVQGMDGQAGQVQGMYGQDGQVQGVDGQDGQVQGLDGQDGQVQGMDGQAGQVQGLDGQDGQVQGMDGQAGQVQGMDGQDGQVLGKYGQAGQVLGMDGQVGQVQGMDGQAGRNLVPDGTGQVTDGSDGHGLASDSLDDRYLHTDGQVQGLDSQTGRNLVPAPPGQLVDVPVGPAPSSDSLGKAPDRADMGLPVFGTATGGHEKDQAGSGHAEARPVRDPDDSLQGAIGREQAADISVQGGDLVPGSGNGTWRGNGEVPEHDAGTFRLPGDSLAEEGRGEDGLLGYGRATEGRSEDGLRGGGNARPAEAPAAFPGVAGDPAPDSCAEGLAGEGLKALAEALREAVEAYDFSRVDLELGNLRAATWSPDVLRAVEVIADDILMGDYGKALEALTALEAGARKDF
jgi:signal transduction histidine kinase